MTTTAILREDGARLLVEGPMVMANARMLREAGRPYCGSQTRIVDLAGVERVDSSGLAVLLDWLRHSRAAGGQLVFSGMPPSLTALAALYDLSELFATA